MFLYGKYRAAHLAATSAVTIPSIPQGPASTSPNVAPPAIPSGEQPSATSVTAPIAAVAPPPAGALAPVGALTPAGLKPLAQLQNPTALQKLSTLQPSVTVPQQTVEHPVKTAASESYRHTHYVARTASTESHHKPAASPHSSSSTSSHIHILSSPNEEVADRLATALKSRGYNVHVKKSGGKWSVDTGAMKNSGQASSTAQALRKSGYSAGVQSN